MLFEQRYLVDPELNILSGTLLELLVPVAFEVDGIDQDQHAAGVHYTLTQQVLDFSWWAVSSK